MEDILYTIEKNSTKDNPSDLLGISPERRKQININALQGMICTPNGFDNIDKSAIDCLQIETLDNNELFYAGFALGSFIGVVSNVN